MKISEISRMLPRLGSQDRDIESWTEEFKRVMELSDISEEKKIFAWAKECVQGRLKGVIDDLKEEEDGIIKYPSVDEIKESIEKYLNITPQEKCFNLKALRIRRGESIKDFNWRYNNYYKNLKQDFKQFITINDYADSIASRPFIRTHVITAKPEDIEKALEIAELAETAIETPNRNNNIVMFIVKNRSPTIIILNKLKNTSILENKQELLDTNKQQVSIK